MTDYQSAPSWFPLKTNASDRFTVMDARGEVFASAPTFENAAVIVLVMNTCVHLDFTPMATFRQETQP